MTLDSNPGDAFEALLQEAEEMLSEVLRHAGSPNSHQEQQDPELAHAYEDNLHLFALRRIKEIIHDLEHPNDGDDELESYDGYTSDPDRVFTALAMIAGLIELSLATLDLDFPRGYAIPTPHP